MKIVQDKTILSPKLIKRKAVQNLKKIASSSTARSSETTKKPSFFKQVSKSENPLQYERLKEQLFVKGDNYLITALSGYIYLNCTKQATVTLSEKDRRALYATKHQETGWKLHINIEPTQISAAWSIIYPILLTHNISAKIIAPDKFKQFSIDKVSSKQVTIYQGKNQSIDKTTWGSIMQQIEDELQYHQIERGILPPANKEVANSAYFSYRNDADANGNYISDLAAQGYVEQHHHEDPTLVAYNLSQATDPFDGIELHATARGTYTLESGG